MQSTIRELSLRDLTTPDAVVTVDDAKEFAQVTYQLADGLFEKLIESATASVETDARRLLGRRTLAARWERFPCGRHGLRIPRWPLQSVDRVSYYATDGTLTDLTGTLVNEEEEPAYLLPAVSSSWPTIQCGRPWAVEVEFTAGYGLADDVPRELREVVLMLVAHRWAVREGPDRPPGYWEAIQPFRLYEF